MTAEAAKQRMLDGRLFPPGDDSIIKEQCECIKDLWAFNQIPPFELEKRTLAAKKVFGKIGENCRMESPLHANWGGKHVFIGNNFYSNFNLTLVDDGNIYIGDGCMFAPNVTIATAGHPIDPELRAQGLQYNADVHIGNNVWLGAGVLVMPGVTIGDNVVIGAGSVVTKDIPSGVVAVGNPCRVMREVGPHDKEFYFKDRRVDL